MNTLLAEVKLAPPGGFKGLGTGPLADPGNNAIPIFAQFLSMIIGLMTIIAFIWFTFRFILGAISIIQSGGDKQAYEDARHKIRNALVGIVVVIAAIFTINLIGTLMGIPNILDITALFALITR